MIKQWRKLKENWLVLLLSAVLTVLGLMVFASWNNATDNLKSAAPLDYVDRENLKQDVVIEKLDVRVEGKVDKDAFDIHMKEMDEDFKYIREKTDDIYKLLIDREK